MPAARLGVAARRHRLVAEIARRLAGRCGVTPGARVVIAVSGGPDSVALLLAGVALRDRRRGAFRIEPAAVHVNHHLRDSSGADEAHAAEVCERYGVPLEVRHVHPGELPGSVGANARRLRYQALASAAQTLESRFVAVAHHAEDQLETLLMALGRGSGLEGLAGMRWSRTLHGEIRLVRPLLASRKADCELLCRAAGVKWCEDPGNAAGVRARLRRDVLGVLEELWPDAARRSVHTADVAAAAGALLATKLEATFGEPSVRRWPRAVLRKLPVPVIAAGLRRAALDARPQAADAVGQTQLLPAAEAIHDESRRPKTFDWAHGVRITVAAREVSLSCATGGGQT